MPRLPQISALAVALGAVALAAGCASSPPADRVVYEVREVRNVPVVGEPVVGGPLAAGPQYQIPPHSGTVVVTDDSDAEAARRAWLDEHYVRRTYRGRSTEERYIPAPEVEPVQVVYREAETPWYYYVPPVALSFGYWGGSHHHDGWNWGVSTGWGWPYRYW